MLRGSKSRAAFERRLIESIERGEEIRPAARPETCTISADLLRRILIGAPVGGRFQRTMGRRCELTAAGVVINGERASGKEGATQERRIVIKPDNDSDVIDLSNLSRPDGNALPPLILRNCVIDGVLRVRGSHFTGFSLQDCVLRKLDADGTQIDGDCRLVGLGALDPEDPGDAGCCQIRLVAARVDGTLDVRGSVLRAPRVAEKDRLQGGRTFADRFALSLASSEIAGRLLLIDGFSAHGGVSLFQAEVRYSVRIADARIEAWYPTDRALDASEMKVAGSFFWLGKTAKGAVEREWHIAGSTSFVRSSIGGDLYFENCLWRMTAATGADEDAGGGVDLRFARIGGQLRFSSGCRISRQSGVQTGLKTQTSVPPALDCWKATFGLGVHLHAKAVFAGPVMFNACHVERDMFIAADIGHASLVNERLPFVQALDLSDTKVDGLIVIDTPNIAGRASFQRLKVEGALQIKRLALQCHSETAVEGYGDMSILDFQDMSVRGIIDFAERAFAVSAVPADPARTFIVDLRGMSCDSLDDADGMCWEGLSERSSRPWRLRYDGVAFSRIEKSTGSAPELSGKQITRHRVESIQSFFRNRPGRPSRAWQRAWVWLRLFITEPSHGDREIRQFSPQAYETFARGYAGRGDMEVAVGLIEARSDVQWLMRVRAFSVRWLPWGLSLFSIICLLTAFLPERAYRIIDIPAWPTLVFAVTMLVPTAIAAIIAKSFKAFFGYGLIPRRAIFTFCLCCGLALLATYRGVVVVPAKIEAAAKNGETGMGGKGEAEKGVHGEEDTFPSRALFAFDTIVPLDLGWKAKYTASEHGWPRIILGLFEILGWIVTSLTIITISGVLKRDIER